VLSENLAQLCGIQLPDFKQTLAEFIAQVHPDDQAAVAQSIEDAAEHKVGNRPVEYRLQVCPSQMLYVAQEIQVITENNQALLIGTVQDITQNKHAESQIHALAYFDKLTGLASRAYYHERIAEYLRSAERYDAQFAFLFVDLDGLKKINDSFGHDVGDAYLKAIAERLRLVVRDIDFAARLGGDEFCLILDKIGDQEQAGEVAGRCLQKINEPLQLKQQQIMPGASIGIAFYPTDGVNEIELMKAADTAMYAAKQSGKHCYRYYAEGMNHAASLRLEQERLLREAFADNQFVLHYQPQISIKTGCMVGVEALIRWEHPEKGLVQPNDFLPMVEELGFIIQLGDWVLENACRQLVQWQAAGQPLVRVAVNIAPLHFQDAGLLSTIKGLLAQTGISPDFLELEVTETAMQSAGTLEIFHQLRALGVKIAIDDFGAGYSCLASLKQLPLDYLKVDRVFVEDILTNTQTAFLLGSIISLANALEYTVIAEGIETREQACVMQGIGCHIVQGYLFSRPVPGDEIPALLNRNFMLD
jgi:diguanylate cyclase (GGDEF)-like protein